ncbi:hypothetical protein [Aquimarina rhabdastrellae]
MKNYFVKSLFIFLFSIFIVGCQKDDGITHQNSESIEVLKKNEAELLENIVDITHLYSYQGKDFRVTYTLNQKERNVIKTSGDTDIAQEIFGKEDAPKTLLFENPIMEHTEISIKVFDSDEEMNRYLKTIDGLPKESFNSNNNKASCNSYNYWGPGAFYFYKHAYYNTEMYSMRRTYAGATGNHWVGSTNNDNLSSIRLGIPINTKGFLNLKEHICYGGKSLNFYIHDYTTSLFGVPNLQWYTLSGWWWWKTSWNDQVSSYRAWCW